MAALPQGAAIGCFSAWNLEGMLAIVDAAEELNLPVALSIDERAREHSGLALMASAAMSLARNSRLPITAHLNHALSLELVEQALSLGMPSIMFDGSHLSLDDNIRLTRRAARLAHAAGAEIEGEIGPLEGDDLPDVARRFVQETLVDFLAVSIPRPSPGAYAPLNIQLMRKLRETANRPLVFHGASRLHPLDISLALCEGLRKINAHTELLKALGAGLREGVAQGSDPLLWLHAGRLACRAQVRACLELYAPPRE